jgi:hypothetical protein
LSTYSLSVHTGHDRMMMRIVARHSASECLAVAA